MKVLVACEESQVVCLEFRKRGHEAYSCDIVPTVGNPAWHIQDDVINLLDPFNEWDMMIAFPPCTYLCSSGLHWNRRRPDRQIKTEKAIGFVQFLLDAPINKIALENPVGCISTQIRKPDQIIQPWMFGEDASKTTCLWLKGLPLLQPTNIIKKNRYANQTPSGQNKLGPSPDRAKIRGITYQGIADAMAAQWG